MSVFTTNVQHIANTVNFHIHVYIYIKQESCTIQKVKILKINLERIYFTWQREDFE